MAKTKYDARNHLSRVQDAKNKMNTFLLFTFPTFTGTYGLTRPTVCMGQTPVGEPVPMNQNSTQEQKSGLRWIRDQYNVSVSTRDNAGQKTRDTNPVPG